MADDNKTPITATTQPSDPEKIKTLEVDLKTAFKSGRFDEVKTLHQTLKELDPENHLADRIMEKTLEEEAAQKKKANAEKIDELEKAIKLAFKSGDFGAVEQSCAEVLALDPENRTAKKVQQQIQDAKEALAAKAKKEKMDELSADLKKRLNDRQWDEAKSLANELLMMDADNKQATKALKTITKETGKEEKPSEAEAMPTDEKKPGFFASLFKKKDKQTATATPTETIPQPVAVSDEKVAMQPETAPAMEVTAPQTEATKQPQAAPLAETQEQPVTEKSAPETIESQQEMKPLSTEPGNEKLATKAANEPTKTAPEGQPSETSKQMTETEESVRESVKTALSPEKPSGIFSGWFKKKAAPAEAATPVAPTMPTAEATAPAQTAPTTEAAPIISATPSAETTPPMPTIEAAPSKIETGEAPSKGNIFTGLFGKKTDVLPEKEMKEAEKPSESIIDTIVSQTGEGKKTKTEKKAEMGTGEGLLMFARAFLRFSVAFVVISAGFFYVYNIDQQNRVLALAGQENYAVRLKRAADTLDQKKDDERKLNLDIQRYQEGYENENKKIIQGIVEKRMDWSDLIRKLNEVTESVYEKNALFQYVQYNNYSYDVATGRLTVSGSLSDPLGKNLTKLAELEEAFTYFPKNKDDAEDTRKPYFHQVAEFRSFTKTFNRATGRFVSNFSLTLSTKEGQ